MERIAQGRSATLSHTFYSNGVATNPSPDSATVAITRADGTALVPSGSVVDAGVGVVTLTLTPSETALLDTLTLRWTATFGGQSQVFTDYVEVAGGFLFSLDQARALAPLNNTTTYTDAKLIAARTTAEQTIEDACGRAFVPRYTRETLHGTGDTLLKLTMPDIRSIRTVTVTTAGVGTAYTAPELALLAINPDGFLYSSTGWTAGIGNITVGYEHGEAYPPARVSQAALILARSLLVKGPVDDRALGQASAGGDFSFGLATPGRNGSWVGLPEVDAVIDQYSKSVGVA
jgi:hypothetical protein